MLKIAKIPKIVIMCQLTLVKWNHRVLPWCSVIKMGQNGPFICWRVKMGQNGSCICWCKGEEIPWVTHGTILCDLSHEYLMGQFYVSRPLGPPSKTFTLAKLT